VRRAKRTRQQSPPEHQLQRQSSAAQLKQQQQQSAIQHDRQQEYLPSRAGPKRVTARASAAALGIRAAVKTITKAVF